VKLDVVYPRLEEGDTVFVAPRVDSTFALGSVFPATATVTVNGVPAQVWDNGAFLAYFPLDTLIQTYRVQAVAPGGELSRFELPFLFPDQLASTDQIIDDETTNSLLPARITLTYENAVLRTDPNQAWWLFPDAGCTALADSFVHPYYRIPLADGLHAWVEDRFVELDSMRSGRPHSTLKSISVSAVDAWTRVRLPLEQRHLFRLEEKPGAGALRLDLYGVSAYIDQIKYDASDPVVGHIRWDQVEDELLRLDILLKTPHLWGYGASYQGDTLVISIRKPPDIKGKALKGRTIVLDAGHGGENEGAIGPTRLLEKEVNLKLAESLHRLLEKEGARVYLTRTADTSVGIYDRIDYALEREAELLISLHNNALPNGKNPFQVHGSAVYYYHPQSRNLAWHIHEELLDATGLADHGLYYKNLALARPTEMLAVLIESAFIIHPGEEMLLRDGRFIKRTAGGIAAGIKEFLRQSRKQNTKKTKKYHTWPSSQPNRLRWPPTNPTVEYGQIHLYVP
jgi:N-acetylmuramoyl-L-alanine amidase